MKKKSFIGLILLALSLQSYSIDLDLESAMNMAIEKNPDMRVKKLEVEKSELEETKTKKARLPIVTAESNYDFIGDIADSSIEASLPIYTGGVLVNNVKLARLDIDVELSELEILKLDVKEQVIFKYFEILNLQKRLEIGNTVIKTLEKQKQRLEDLFRSKLISKSELLKVDSDLLASEASKFRDEKAMEKGFYDLKILLGLDLSEKLVLKEFKYQDIEVESYDLESDIIKALTNGYRADMEKIKVERAEMELDAAKADFEPEVSVSVGYDFNEFVETDDEKWRVTLGVSWELFSWGSSIHNMNQRKKSLEQADIGLKKGLDELAVEIRGRYNEIQTLHIETRTEEKKLEISRENLKIDTLRYYNDMIPSLDYLDSVESLKESEEEFYRLQSQLIVAKMEYENLLK